MMEEELPLLPWRAKGSTGTCSTEKTIEEFRRCGDVISREKEEEEEEEEMGEKKEKQNETEDRERKIKEEIAQLPIKPYPLKKYCSLSSLNIQNIAAEWSKDAAKDSSPLDEDVRLSRSWSVASDLTPSRLNPSKRDVRQRRALYCSLPFMCQFGMHQRENEVVDVLKSLHEMTIPEKRVGILDEVVADKNNLTLPLFLATLVVMGAQFIVGYNLVVLNVPEKYIFSGHSTLQWAVVVSALAIGAPFGAYSGGYIANMMGRRSDLLVDRYDFRTAIILTNWIFLLSGLSILISPFIEFLMIGRLFLGFGCGVSLVVGPIYLGEIAAPTVRGALGTCIQFALVIGIFCATVLAYPFASSSTWRILFLITPCVALIGLMLSGKLPESPRWLLLKNKQLACARHVIKVLRGFLSEEDVDVELESMLFACCVDSKEFQQEAIWDIIFTKSVDLRKSIAMIVFLQFCQQFSGINTVFYYSSLMLKDVMTSPMLGTISLALVNVFAIYLALVLMDHVKRKTLLLISDAGMLLSLIVVSITLSVDIIPNIIAFVCLLSFVIFFELGLGPIPCLVAAELFDVRSVASAMTVACIGHWIFNILVGLTFPFLLEYLVSFCFLPYIFVLIVGFISIVALFEDQPPGSIDIEEILKTTSHVQGEILSPIEEDPIEENLTV